MKILFLSHVFYPSVGGIEVMSLALATEFVKQGHSVVVATATPGKEPDAYPFEVIRRPSAAKLLALMRSCDVCFQNNISLRTLWPLLLVRKPWVLAHRTWISRADGKLAPQDRLKRFLCRYATNISNSDAVAASLPVASTVIGNSYRQELFKELPNVERTTDLIYVGRLVYDKGVDLLLTAMSLLRDRGIYPKLTIVGDGEERASLQALAQSLQLNDDVSFVGYRSGNDLAQIMNRHKILVVPSRWNEPYGIVALEGIACGCIVVASEGGGLKDAIGPCGMTFPNGDANALADSLESLFRQPGMCDGLKQEAATHLFNRKPDTVASEYLFVLQQSLVNCA